MIHNESMNVWTHFGGMVLFICCVFYVMIYLQPTSFHEAPLPLRWSSNFDNGRFDLLQCDNPNFKFPKGTEDQCPYKVDELLDDLLETELLIEYTKNLNEKDPITMSHFKLNQHGMAFERADHFIRNALEVLTKPPAFFHK